MIYKITVLNSPGMQSVWMQHKAVPAPARRDCAESAGGNGKSGLMSQFSDISPSERPQQQRSNCFCQHGTLASGASSFCPAIILRGWDQKYFATHLSQRIFWTRGSDPPTPGAEEAPKDPCSRLNWWQDIGYQKCRGMAVVKTSSTLFLNGGIWNISRIRNVRPKPMRIYRVLLRVHKYSYRRKHILAARHP